MENKNNTTLVAPYASEAQVTELLRVCVCVCVCNLYEYLKRVCSPPGSVLGGPRRYKMHT